MGQVMMLKAVINQPWLLVLIIACLQPLAHAHDAESENVVLPSESMKSKVMFSIKPLALLYIELTGLPVHRSQILLGPGNNVHDYQLKMSDLKRLSVAQRIFWLGPENEALFKDLAAKDTDNKWLALTAESHAWLGGQSQIALVQQFSAMLQKQLPNRRQLIQQNESTLLATLDQIFSDQRQQVKVMQAAPVILAHTAFSPWLASLGLPEPEYFSSGHSHGQAAQGGKHNLHVQQDIAEGKLICAVEEPDAHFDQLERKFPQLNVMLLEPLADSQPLEVGAWLRFWQSNWQTLNACMTP